MKHVDSFWLRFVLCACLAFVILPLPSLAGRPNVILIMADDQGYGDLSAHGNPVLKTPHMDRLHSESVRLTDFHVAPMCSPTRGQLMTGWDAMRTGCTAVCQGRSMIRSEFPTMANFFADSGYATGHFGKWHLGDSYPHRPQDRGFHETVHHRAWGITSLADYWGNTYFDPVLSHNGTDKKYKGYCTDIFFRQAIDWIDDQVKSGKPFFAYLPTNTPHVPNVCPEKFSAPYVGKYRGKTIPAKFYGMIANLDENLGKLEAFLKERKLRDNTILIYLSDNGTQSRQAQALFNAGMRDRKTSIMEGGHRVPCFIRWPSGPLKHKRDVDSLTQVQDLLPTLIELCGLKAASHTFNGTSLAGLLKGTLKRLPDRKLVIQYRVSGEKWSPAVVLWNKWRLVGPGRLYHVGHDPHQDKNVAEKHPEIARAMEKHYDSWHAQAKRMFEKPRWIRVGSDRVNPMMLYGQDWVGGYCDNRANLIRATAVGHWHVIVEKAGVYELELRRWPKESKLKLSEGTGAKRKLGKRPIASARLEIGKASYALDCKPGDTHVIFRARVKAGKTKLKTLFLNAGGKILCSAIYVKLKRLPDSTDIELTPPASKPSSGTR